MQKTISALKVDLQAAIGGTNLDRVQAVNEKIELAAGDLLLDLDLRETKRTAQLENALYDEVYDYVLPPDVKGRKLIDLRPQFGRDDSDNIRQRFQKEFDYKRDTATFAIRDNSAVKTLRINMAARAGILIHECDAIASNGTWAAAGGASGLEPEDIYYVTGAGALRFDLALGGGYLENADFSPVDLSDHEGDGAVFMLLYIPVDADPTDLTSVALRWGSSAAAYWTASVTATHDGSAFHTGVNILRFNWPASATGSPDASAMDYLRATFVTSDAIADLRMDSIVSKLPTPYEIDYYSNCLFRTAAGVWTDSVSAAADPDSLIINLETESYSLLLDRVMMLLAPQLRDKDAAFDLDVYTTHYEKNRKKYVKDNPSEAQRPQSVYYRQPFGRRIA
jgi:hypothetical protein